MTFPVSSFRAPAWKPLALVSALSAIFILPVHAETEEVKSLSPVVVTASRFASDADVPIGASVITSTEIASAGIESVNEAVRKLGGVYGRQSMYGTSDYNLDLRGFGTNSAQNMVVLVDGVRLSENEQAVALLSSIPINTVDHIEIIRGGSSVLYGDGATAGVIHVITKRGAAEGVHGSITVEDGQFDHHALRSSIAMGKDGFSLDANASKVKSDNYRDNNAATQENFGGGMQWMSREGRAGVRVDVARQDSRMPGALFSLEEFNTNPRQTHYPNDYVLTDTNRYTAFIERKIGRWEAAAELSYRDKKFSSYMSGASSSKSDQTQFSPRLRHTDSIGAVKNELVMGVDLIHWNSDAENAYSNTDATQKSVGIYAQDEMQWDQARLVLGARHEKFKKDTSGTTSYAVDHSLNAWEAQGSYALSKFSRLFAKGGQSYRVANVDDNNSTVVSNTPIKPQTSHDWEIGVSFGNKENKLTARWFLHRIKNEIFYDPTVGAWGANTNLDPTKREGIEIEGGLRIATEWMLNANYQYVQAEFTDGPNKGNEMVLVPKNIATIRLAWVPVSGHSAWVGMQWVDEQRYGGDFDNSSTSRIPSHVTFDARYARKIGPWEFAISGTNLTNKHYFTNAYGSGTGTSWGIYPDAERQIKLSAKYDF